MKKQRHGHAGKRGKNREWVELPSRTYMSWQSMHSRVSGKHSESHYYYGVKVNPRWDDFQNFLDDMGERPEGLSLDRIDRSKDYGPDNCRWATKSQQNKNRRTPLRSKKFTAHGETLAISEWAAKLNVNKETLRARINKGMPIEKALVSTPIARRPVV